jgi:hypothetical protein
MNNYIGKVDAEWVDPAVELPPELVDVTAIIGSPAYLHVMQYNGDSWSGRSGLVLPVPVAWLRIGGPTDAIPRAQVQAAVDEIDRRVRMGLGGLNAATDPDRIAACEAYENCIGLVTNHTGVTPRG